MKKQRDGIAPLPDLATLPPDGGPEFNRLVFATSPYLLQHARNPVDWHPWGEEAFAKAAREDRPIFLSIGYSTCHWCHVMEHESFENEETAQVLNDHFVAVKVDREERPDIDHIYMDVCQALTGGGGWPLSLFLAPDKTPFFAGTYFPDEPRYGQPSFRDLLHQINRLWQSDRPKITAAGAQIMELFSRPHQISESVFSWNILDRAEYQFGAQFDEEFGGFGRAPKFPMGHSLRFLLRRAQRKQSPRLLHAVEHTLEKMFRGGLYDHVGFGFCRYSVDRQWLVPHFEKMLYDNALLVMAYTEAWLATRKPLYKSIVDEVFTYISRDMTAESGMFFSAENADSEGEEGKFYVFTAAEFEQIVGTTDAPIAAAFFGVTPTGNFEHGKTILTQALSLAELAAQFDRPLPEIAELIARARERLFAARAQRIHPSLDDKILVSWNALMISGFSLAAQAFDRPDYAGKARSAARALLTATLTPEGTLFHSFCQGKPGVPGFLDDYAFLIGALLDLYETDFDAEWLTTALTLEKTMIREFHDPATGRFFLTAHGAEKLITRPKDGYDGAIPSGNSMAALVSLRLARLTGQSSFEKLAQGVFNSLVEEISPAPNGFSLLLTAADLAQGPTTEIVLVGPDIAAVTPLLKVIHQSYLPRKTVLFIPTGTGAGAKEEAGAEKGAAKGAAKGAEAGAGTVAGTVAGAEPEAGAGPAPASPALPLSVGFIKPYAAHQGPPTAFLCQNSQCRPPISDPGELAQVLQESRPIQ
jgi:hypothetical protein